MLELTLKVAVIYRESKTLTLDCLNREFFWDSLYLLVERKLVPILTQFTNKCIKLPFLINVSFCHLSGQSVMKKTAALFAYWSLICDDPISKHKNGLLLAAAEECLTIITFFGTTG